MAWFRRRAEERFDRLERLVERLVERDTEARAGAREQPAPQGADAALAPVAQALAETLKAFCDHLSKGAATQEKLIGTMLERSAKLAFSATAAEMGRRSGDARKKKHAAVDASQIFLAEVRSNCAECESKLEGVPCRSPGDLAKHLSENHDATIMPQARRVRDSILRGQPELPLNGQSSL